VTNRCIFDNIHVDPITTVENGVSNLSIKEKRLVNGSSAFVTIYAVGTSNRFVDSQRFSFILCKAGSCKEGIAGFLDRGLASSTELAYQSLGNNDVHRLGNEERLNADFKQP
jgi:hypothetical protein